METHDDILRFIKGTEATKTVVTEALKKCIPITLEFSILSMMLILFGGMLTATCIFLFILTFVTLITCICMYSIYNNKYNGVEQEYLNNIQSVNYDQHDVKKYVDATMEIMKIGVATVVINMVTFGFSLLLLIVALLSFVG